MRPLTLVSLLALAFAAGVVYHATAIPAHAAPSTPYYCAGPLRGDARPGGCEHPPDGSRGSMGTATVDPRAQCPACAALDEQAAADREAQKAAEAADRLAHISYLVQVVNTGGATPQECDELAALITAANP